MRYQRVTMTVEFEVPIGRDAYGVRQDDEAKWSAFAEHDMLEHLKDIEEIPEGYWGVDRISVSFTWGEEFNRDD